MAKRDTENVLNIEALLKRPPRIDLPPCAEAHGAGVARVAAHLYEMLIAEIDHREAQHDARIAALEALCFGHADVR